MAIDPRTVDFSELVFYKLGNLNDLPSFSGLYLVFVEGRVLYIGKSKNIRNRWIGGHHQGLEIGRYYDVARIACIPCAPRYLKETEDLFISWFDAPLNGTPCEATRVKIKRVLQATPIPVNTQKDNLRIDRLILLLADLNVNADQHHQLQEAVEIAASLRFPCDTSIQTEQVLFHSPVNYDLDEDAEFDRLWNAVKKKVNRKSARKAFHRVRSSFGDTTMLIAELERQQDWHIKHNGHLQYLSNPDKWLNCRRWEDDYSTLTTG